MITIIVDTQDEYDDIMEYAEEYMCGKMSGGLCQGYATKRCEDCFEVFHIKYGIRVVPPVDNDKSSEL